MLEPSEKRRAVLLLLLMLVGAALEVVGIGLFVPFAGLVNDPSLIERQPVLNEIRHRLGDPDPRRMLMIGGVALIAAFLFKNVYSIFLLNIQNRYLLNRHLRLEAKLFTAYLRRPYTFHLQRNPAELVQNLRNVAVCITNVMLPLLTLLAEAMVALGVLALLAYAKPQITVIAAVGVCGLGAVFFKLVRLRARQIGVRSHEAGIQYVKWMNQGLAGVKEIKVLGREAFFVDMTMQYSRGYNKAALDGQIMGQVSRPFIEVVGLTGLVAFVMAVALSGRDPKAVIPTLVLFAGAAFRLMPALTRILGAAMVIRQSGPMVDSVHQDLEHAEPTGVRAGAGADAAPAKPFEFREAIELQDVTYQYPGARAPSLVGVNLEIRRGQSVAFVGHSGAGKSTVVDCLLGLLPEIKGRILIDGHDLLSHVSAWQRKIGYIPQSIYLSDDSIRRNVAFGLPVEEIDEERVRRALRDSRLEQFVQALPLGLDTEVGDRGTRLSGGQRQRIGIARALYRNPEVVVLDEATSALDNETEREVAQAIEQLRGEKTIVVIAHRLSTVARCDRLFFMQEGKIVASGTYQELVDGNEGFRRFANL